MISRKFCPLVFLVVCLAATSLQGRPQTQEAVNPELRADVEAFMEKMRETFLSGDAKAAAKMFDHLSLIERAESTGLFEFSAAFDREGFITGFESRIEKSMELWSDMFSWDKVEVRHIERIDDLHVVVTSRHWDDEQQVYSKNRWWLKKADAQADWQFYDLVDMDMNVRTSMMVALATAAAMDRKPWLQSMMEIVALVQQFGSDLESVVEVEGMQKRLEMLTQEDVPVEIRTFALTLLTIKYIGTENRLDDALETIEEIGRLDPKSALRFFMQGNVYVAMEEPQKAISSFEKYAAAYGWEADVCESVSDVYMQLGNAEKSIEYATRGLADNKDSWGCLISLLVALPDEQKSQIDEHLKAMDHNIDVIEIAIDYAIEIDDLTSARHMYRLLQKHHPDSELVDYYQEQFDQ